VKDALQPALIREFIRVRPELVGYLTQMLHSHGDAEDVAQETCLRLLRADPDQIVNFPRAYIFRIGRNLALDLLRRSKRLNAAISSGLHTAESAVTAPGPEDEIASDEQLALAQQAVSRLPTRCQRVYLLRNDWHLSHKEIARILNISVRTVENHIARATMSCREYLELQERGGVAPRTPKL